MRRILRLICALVVAAVLSTPAIVHAVLPTPTIQTTASASVSIGGSISDQATLAGGASPTGTITFLLFIPSDPTCTGVPYLTSTVAVSGNGMYVSASSITYDVGTYRWVASYSGDANNNPSAGLCNDPGESVVVTKANPSLTTAASHAAPIGGHVSDRATLAGGDAGITGTITFSLFGPSNPTCTGVPLFTSPAGVGGPGTYSSAAFIASTIGTYNWVAAYSGDAHNNSISGLCGDPGESVSVSADEIFYGGFEQVP